MSISNQIIVNAAARGFTATLDGKIRSPDGSFRRTRANPSGYFQFCAPHNKLTRGVLVHRFVAYCKYGEVMFNAECVRHLDGNKTNNSWDNVVVGTMKENCADKPKEVRARGPLASAEVCRKLTDSQIRSIRYWYKKPHPDTGIVYTLKILTECYGVAHASVWKIVKRIGYKHVQD